MAELISLEHETAASWEEGVELSLHALHATKMAAWWHGQALLKAGFKPSWDHANNDGRKLIEGFRLAVKAKGDLEDQEFLMLPDIEMFKQYACAASVIPERYWSEVAITTGYSAYLYLKGTDQRPKWPGSAQDLLESARDGDSLKITGAGIRAVATQTEPVKRQANPMPRVDGSQSPAARAFAQQAVQSLPPELQAEVIGSTLANWATREAVAQNRIANQNVKRTAEEAKKATGTAPDVPAAMRLEQLFLRARRNLFTWMTGVEALIPLKGEMDEQTREAFDGHMRRLEEAVWKWFGAGDMSPIEEPEKRDQVIDAAFRIIPD